MRSTFITEIGLHTERISGLQVLATAIASDVAPTAQSDRYSKMATSLDPRLLQLIDREDRAILNEISVSVLNALADASPPGSALWQEEHNELLVFASTDALEHDFGPIAALASKNPSARAVLDRMGDLRNLANPLSMLRHLSTNTTYHVSKRLRARGGGYPTQSMSLSGICAMEDACLELANAPEDRSAIVVASGNMRSFDSVLAFGKLGLLGARDDGGGVDPSWGASALLLETRGITPKRAIGRVVAVDTLFAPNSPTKSETWDALIAIAKSHHQVPDVIVTYANGAAAQDEVEADAIRRAFPDVRTRNYKKFFGYTGKANNLLDLAAALADTTITPGSMILLNGQGFSFGIGYLLIEKLATAGGARVEGCLS